MRRARLIIPILVLVALAAWGIVALLGRERVPSGAVEGSGTIEVDQVAVASKLPGRIQRLHAAEGEDVRAGQVLVTIEGRELAAQIDQARAAVDVARARVAQAHAALALQIRQVEAQVAQAQAAVEAARTRVGQAQETRELASTQSTLSVQQAAAALAAARASSAAAKAGRDRAAADLQRVEALFSAGAVSGQALDAARAAFTTAEAQYAASGEAVAQAETALRLARENAAQVSLREREVSAARAQQRQAEAALRLAQAGAELITQRRADVAAAQAAQAQAEAGLRVLLTQQQNLAITSPVAGVVLSRHASAGEIVAAGAPILTVGTLSDVTLRVFIPLPKVGAVALGQRAQVTTDALPGRTFAGTVTEISQQAEFTPRNVQTREERVKQVFAVTVTLANPDRLLKPGMPADAVITTR